jgi:DNA-binding ferritin-like protein
MITPNKINKLLMKTEQLEKDYAALQQHADEMAEAIKNYNNLTGGTAAMLTALHNYEQFKTKQ